jgi:hypothetical protein
MTHPTPPLSGENLLLDDEDVILLTDEIPPAEKHDLIEICQLADPSVPQDAQKLSETETEKPALIDFSDVIGAADFKTELPPDFSALEETEILNFDLKDPQVPVSEYQPDDLQRLIDEVVHDSQVPPQDFAGISPEIGRPKDSLIVDEYLTSLTQDKIDAAVERVIQNLFAERIEKLLDEVVTTAVNREIENLKTILLNYLTSGKTGPKFKS